MIPVAVYPHEPGYRRDDPSTSEKAAKSVASAASTHRDRLEDAYRAAGPSGLSAYEAGVAAGLEDTGYWKRCSELYHQGAIEKARDARGQALHRVNPVTGMSQVVHVYVPLGARRKPPKKSPIARSRIADLPVHECTCGDQPLDVVDVQDLLNVLKETP